LNKRDIASFQNTIVPFVSATKNGRLTLLNGSNEKSLAIFIFDHSFRLLSKSSRIIKAFCV
jgi:hypothetical protein